MNDHIVKTDNNMPFHSHGFAQIASGDRIGSTAKTTFSARLQIDRNRNLIGNYQRSSIGSSYGAMRAKTFSTRFNAPNSGSSARSSYNPYA